MTSSLMKSKSMNSSNPFIILPNTSFTEIITQMKEQESFLPLSSLASHHIKNKSINNRQSHIKQWFHNLTCKCFGRPLHRDTNNNHIKNDNKDEDEIFIGPQSKINKGKKSLILDLDETLVHSTFEDIPNPDITLPIDMQGLKYTINVIKRPGVHEFLTRMAQTFEIIVYTASISQYATPLIDELDKSNVIAYRLFRQHCTQHEKGFIKDLSRLGRNLKDVILIDNSENSALFQPNNAYLIKNFFFDQNDKELYRIMPFLELLADLHDVRPVNKWHQKFFHYANNLNKTDQFSPLKIPKYSINHTNLSQTIPFQSQTISFNHLIENESKILNELSSINELSPSNLKIPLHSDTKGYNLEEKVNKNILFNEYDVGKEEIGVNYIPCSELKIHINHNIETKNLVLLTTQCEQSLTQKNGSNNAMLDSDINDEYTNDCTNIQMLLPCKILQISPKKNILFGKGKMNEIGDSIDYQCCSSGSGIGTSSNNNEEIIKVVSDRKDENEDNGEEEEEEDNGDEEEDDGDGDEDDDSGVDDEDEDNSDEDEDEDDNDREKDYCNSENYDDDEEEDNNDNNSNNNHEIGIAEKHLNKHDLNLQIVEKFNHMILTMKDRHSKKGQNVDKAVHRHKLN